MMNTEFKVSINWRIFFIVFIKEQATHHGTLQNEWSLSQTIINILDEPDLFSLHLLFLAWRGYQQMITIEAS